MKLTPLRFAIPMLTLLTAACASDPNPIDLPAPSQHEDAQAFINLSFDVADSKETRAGEELQSTEEEKKISKVALYVFNQAGVLEDSFKDCVVESNALKEDVKLKSTGLKTIYAIAYDQLQMDPIPESPQIADFLNLTITSSKNQIASPAGFTMIGNIKQTPIVKGENKLTIDMTRVAAKAQVMNDPTTHQLTLGDITFSDIQFMVRQSSREISIGGTKDFSSGLEKPQGSTYSHLSEATNDGESYTQSVTAFRSDNCAYMAENPIPCNVTGKATFLSIKMKAKPSMVYQKDEDGEFKKVAFDAGQGKTIYAVGKTNPKTAVTAYAMNGNEVMLFGDLTEATTYCNEYDPKNTNGYGVIAFTNGDVYYRVNIKHIEGSVEDGNRTEQYKVLRNTFYKINLTDVKALGNNSEVIPTDADTPIDITDVLLGVTFTVADWNGQDIDVSLE